MRSVNFSIAVDGPSSSGKGTLAVGLANYYNLPYLDTGAMYRSFAALVMEKLIDPQDKLSVINLAKTFQYNLSSIRNSSEDVARVASMVSAIPDVRDIFVKWQRSFSKDGAVLDGRDIGSVILKDASYKFYITADLSIRAQRRFNELKVKNIDCDLDSIMLLLKQRDENDLNRLVAPLKISDDAVVIDASHLTSEEVLNFAIKSIQSKD
ncbi:Cytidylate kinase [Candidatus Xenohaliotis californiensis]|uniref:Cytidylate kinase n=1 Tax=Candidatus Xenohaliotis californiensis TaxID=84677 RepID=A0ABM9N7V4_9RICK|nr:Cytidylate kinase [Candidatus Xenohaliotis californiensis]